MKVAEQFWMLLCREESSALSEQRVQNEATGGNHVVDSALSAFKW